MQKKSWKHFEKVEFFLDRSSQSTSDGQGCGHVIFQIHKWIYKTTQEVRIIAWNMFSFLEGKMAIGGLWLDIKSIHYHLNSDVFLENVSVFMRNSFEKMLCWWHWRGQKNEKNLLFDFGYFQFSEMKV